MKITKVHIDSIEIGDTIMHNGSMKTVCSSNLKKGGFMGTSIFGDSYSSGSRLIQKVTWRIYENA